MPPGESPHRTELKAGCGSHLQSVAHEANSRFFDSDSYPIFCAAANSPLLQCVIFGRFRSRADSLVYLQRYDEKLPADSATVYTDWHLPQATICRMRIRPWHGN
jgi:hypothetical protein